MIGLAIIMGFGAIVSCTVKVNPVSGQPVTSEDPKDATLRQRSPADGGVRPSRSEVEDESIFESLIDRRHAA